MTAQASFALTVLCGVPVTVGNGNENAIIGQVKDDFELEGAEVRICSLGKQTVVVGIFPDRPAEALIFSH